ncbi:hypothetical protein RHMOL_Rhmol06G0255000 [Rhododendron molle]|uniref:Uncharacterized protein n=1 Tax=Rhododendron molle TaxID=49168 RepID=A0ACC0NGB4_RHOML|nr:hypothetical protein RHMOL_Rhmol06G0255000 [Rhododendron molle]
MESEGTAQSQTSSAKDKQARRLWTHKEEECLLAAMMECISEKYRAHNGFKPGYFNEVEKELKKKLPGTTLKAVPNIESKVKTWKKMYALILDITRISGFGWNYATNSIQVDSEDVWKEYEKSNTKAKGMNGKAFPMYESWQFLFGRDRATGEGAEDAAELDDIPGDPVETINPVDLFNDCYTPSFANGDPAFVDITTSSGTPTSYANPTTPRSNANTPAINVGPERPKKKAKVDANEPSLHDAIGNYMAQSSTALNKIAESVGFDDRLAAKKEKAVFLGNDAMFTSNGLVGIAFANYDGLKGNLVANGSATLITFEFSEPKYGSCFWLALCLFVVSFVAVCYCCSFLHLLFSFCPILPLWLVLCLFFWAF